jgi:hypothetical protein
MVRILTEFREFPSTSWGVTPPLDQIVSAFAAKFPWPAGLFVEISTLIPFCLTLDGLGEGF